MTNTGIVVSLTGVVKAIATDGSERVLNIGDRVFVDEQVVSGDTGTVAIEFADGLVMDLGRNAQSILDEGILNLDFDIESKDVSPEEEVQATQAALLQNKDFDPTVDLEAPAAGGGGTVEGAGEDDGFNIIQVEYAEPRITPDSGFETKGIGVDFTEILPELILEPQAIQGAVFAVAGDSGTVPVEPPSLKNCEIFTLSEDFVEGGPELTDGDSSKWLGFRLAPSEQDTVTSITIKGFPENTNLSESDWLIAANAKVVDQDANYQVNFVSGPSQSSDNTWEVTVEVIGALPGEEVSFILSVIPMDNVAPEVTLEVEATVDNSSGGFTSSEEKTIAISFDEDESVTPPDTSIFTLNEEFVEGAPELVDGDSSKWLGFRVAPSEQDAVTSVTIKGFPENIDLSKSDWLITQDAKVVDLDANYQVNFAGGPTQSPDDTWEVTVNVTGALAGEEVSFVLSVIPMENIDTSVPLIIETTVDNSSGGFTSSALESVGISFLEQPQDVFASTSGSDFTSFSVDAAVAVLPINSFVSQDLDALPADIL
jgi:hypothetical protein